MKTTKEDFDNAAKNKKEVKFGKSTTYAVDEEQIKQIGEKDISEGRNETERIKHLIEEEEKNQMEAMKKMEEWKVKDVQY